MPIPSSLPQPTLLQRPLSQAVSSSPAVSPEENHSPYQASIRQHNHSKSRLRTVLVLTRKLLRIPYPITLHLSNSHFLNEPKSLASPSLYQNYIKKWHKQAKIAITDLEPFQQHPTFSNSIAAYQNSKKIDDLAFLLQRKLLAIKHLPAFSKNIQQKALNNLLIALTLLHLQSPENHGQALLHAKELYQNNFDDPSTILLYALVLQKLPNTLKASFNVLRNLRNHENITPQIKFIALEQISRLHASNQQLEPAAKTAFSMLKLAQKENILNPRQLRHKLIESATFANTALLADVAIDICLILKPLLKSNPEFQQLVQYHTIFALAQSQKNQWQKALKHIKIANKLSKERKFLSGYASTLLCIINIAQKAQQSSVALNAMQQLRIHAQQQQLPHLALYCGMLMAQTYENNKQWSKLANILQTILPEAQQSTNSINLITILHKLTLLHIQTGDYIKAHHAVNYASALSFNLKNSPQTYQTSCLLTAMLSVRTGRLSSAEFWFERARSYSHQVDTIYAASLANLGYLKFQQGKTERAINAWERARNVYRHHRKFDKIQKMNKTIHHLYTQKPKVTDIMTAKTKIMPPGPTLTSKGRIKRPADQLPNYVISDFVLS